MYFGGYILFFFMPSFVSIVILGEVFDLKLTYTFLKTESIEFILYCNIIVTFFIFIQSFFSKTYLYKNIDHKNLQPFDFLLYVSIFFYIIKSFRLILFVFEYGFLSYYTDYTELFIINLFWYIGKFYIIFYIWWFDILKINKIFLLCFLISLISILVFGFRHEAIFFLVNIIFRYQIFRKPKNLLNKKLFLFFIFLAISLQAISLFRTYNFKIESFQDVSLKTLFIGALASQNGVPVFAGLAYENIDFLSKKTNVSVLSPFLDPINRLITGHNGAHNTEYLKITKNIDHQLTYHLNSNYWLNGGGMGSSFIFEAYFVFWYFGLILLLLFNAYVINNIMSFNKYIRLFVCMNLFHFFYMWRSSYMFSFEGVVGFLMVLTIWKLFTNAKSRKRLAA